MVGDGQRRHFEGERLRDQFLDAAGSVEKAVLGMKVQMDKIGVGHRGFF
jgi:hypothetical protein